MRRIPTGTVTFLFTDIDGSTRLLHELGAERYAEALAAHRRALRAAFVDHGGVEIDTQGDAFFVAFPTALGALEAAEDAQEALRGGPVGVRIGVHTGTPLATDEGYVGVDVHRAARIAAAGHGGQVILSEATAALAESLPLRDLGVHRLKDLTAPQRLLQLGDAEFPPLKTLYATNLPVQPTAFLGRERELAEVVALSAREDVRLLTLTGPGGSGKTRLALQAAAEHAEAFEHGVWWVPLQTVTDPALVVPTVAGVLGADDVASHIGDRRLLLVLDNLEQVVEAATDLGDILAACRQLRVLTTSREALRLEAEHEYAVPPFVDSEAVGFFGARARAVDPGYSGDAAVRALCARLDFLPLALELAAARIKLMSPARMLERLDRALPLLTAGRRDAPARQRTLRATIAWSHDLLDADEQRLFRRLSVFAGGWTIDAAERVSGASIDLLQSLADKSLIRVEDDRFRMLETIREFAGERLEELGEAPEIRRRHAEHFLALAEAAGLSADSEEPQRFESTAPEADNLRSAMDWAETSGGLELALRIAVALEAYWVAAIPFEGAYRLEALVAHLDDVPPLLRARALRTAGGVAYITGEFARGVGYYERSLAEFRRLGDEQAVGHMLHRLAMEALRTGDVDAARDLTRQALALHVSKRSEALGMTVLADISFQEGKTDLAIEQLLRAADVADETGFVWWPARLQAAEYALQSGRADDARGLAARALASAHAIGDRQHVVYALGALAWHAAETGAAEAAGRLWGAIEREEARGPVGQWERERADYARRVESVAGIAFEAGRAEGRRLSLDEAVRLTLSTA